MPIGKYTIEIEGNHKYLPTSKFISLINDDDEDIITIFVGIKPRLDNDFEFKFIREDKLKLNSSKLEAKAILLPDKNKAA